MSALDTDAPHSLDPWQALRHLASSQHCAHVNTPNTPEMKRMTAITSFVYPPRTAFQISRIRSMQVLHSMKDCCYAGAEQC